LRPLREAGFERRIARGVTQRKTLQTKTIFLLLQMFSLVFSVILHEELFVG